MINFKHETRLFFTALMFFTRIPCASWADYSETSLGKSSYYLPMVGIVTGGIAALVFWISDIIFSTPAAILLSMIATIITTGAFHEDGFTDCCDGFGGGWEKARVLAIMKDSSIGAFGAIGIGLLLSLKFFALSEIPQHLLPVAMIAGHSLSRFMAVSFIYTHDYVREDESSKSKSVAKPMSVPALVTAGITGILPLFFTSKSALLTLIPVFISRWLMGHYFVKRIGGYTGDCLGAVQQVTEVVFYLFIGAEIWKFI